VTVLRAVDLNGLELGTAPPTVRTMVNDVKCLRFAAGSHVVFARSADSGMNGMLPKVDFTFSFGLTNSGGSIFVGTGGQVLDQVMYASSKSGVAASLDPAKTTPAANDDPLNFCSATTTYGAGDKGTPGAANPSCGAIVQEGKCNDGGTMRDVAAPKAGDLVINEIMADPNAVSDASGEWFEVYVNANVDLNGVTIGADATSVKDTLASADCLKAQMGSYLVFAHSDDSSMNGGLPHVDYVMTFGLTNSAGHTLALGRGGALLDLASYPAAKSGVAAQLSSAKQNSADNDNAANFCDATMMFGAGDKGTPGKANGTCP
jgi:hypothetical protein